MVRGQGGGARAGRRGAVCVSGGGGGRGSGANAVKYGTDKVGENTRRLGDGGNGTWQDGKAEKMGDEHDMKLGSLVREVVDAAGPVIRIAFAGTTTGQRQERGVIRRGGGVDGRWGSLWLVPSKCLTGRLQWLSRYQTGRWGVPMQSWAAEPRPEPFYDRYQVRYCCSRSRLPPA